MKVTVQLNPSLYRAIQAESVRSGRSVDAIMDEAIAAWLTAAEEQDDRESATAALADYQRVGGIAAEDFFKTMAAASDAPPT